MNSLSLKNLEQLFLYLVCKDWSMIKTGMVCGIADVHHSELEEYVSLFPLDILISSALFKKKKKKVYLF